MTLGRTPSIVHELRVRSLRSRHAKSIWRLEAEGTTLSVENVTVALLHSNSCNMK